MQFERVAVEPLPGPCHRGPDGVEPFFQPAAAALQDPQPDVGAGLPEEREMHAEPVVFPGRGPRLGQQVLQPFLAVRRQPVNDLRAAAGPRAPSPSRPRRASGLVLGDQPLREQFLQARVERAIPEGTERTEQRVQALTQLVAVHRGLVQQAKDSEFEHPAALSSHRCPHLRACPGSPGLYDAEAGEPCMANRCIGAIHRQDMSKRARVQTAGHLAVTGRGQSRTGRAPVG